VKKNAKGYTETWNGFKLHVDVKDTGLPLSAILTPASLHDSQVAIPLMKLTSSKMSYCYDRMDAAYYAVQIWAQSRELGHVPIIDCNPRRGKVVPMAPHEAKRYNERCVVERFNGRLKEEFGGRNVMVRGQKGNAAPDVWSCHTFCVSVTQSNWLLIVKDRLGGTR